MENLLQAESIAFSIDDKVKIIQFILVNIILHLFIKNLIATNSKYNLWTGWANRQTGCSVLFKLGRFISSELFTKIELKFEHKINLNLN